MEEKRNCKNFFYFLQFFLFRGIGVIGVLLIFLGGVGLLFTKQNKIVYFVLCLFGYVLIASSSYAGFVAMNQREENLSLRALRNKKV